MRPRARSSTGGLGGLSSERIAHLLLALLLAATLLVWWQAWQSLRSHLSVTFVDVGEGDCIIVRSPTGRSLLIDGGGRGNNVAADETGKWLVLPALYRQGVRRLDAIIATHPHDDHVGGLAQVIEQLPVGMVLNGGGKYSSQPYDNFLAAVKRRRVSLLPARPGQVFNLGGGSRAEVLYPVAPLSGTEEDINNNSVAIRLSYGRESFLFLADVQQEGEAALLAEYPGLNATVIKVAHHGSMDATSAELLQAVRPKWAVISAGRSNPFGHPHGETLLRLKEAGVRVFRTDQLGTIEITSDGRTLQAEWEQEGRLLHAEIK